MLLTELRDSQVPYEVIHATRHSFRATGEVNGRTIRVTCLLSDEEQDKWDFEFLEVRGNKATVRKTGSGKPFEVFALVMAVAQDFIARYKPAIIAFAAAKETGDSGARARIYAKLASKLSNYELLQSDDEDGTAFTLYRRS